MTCPRLPLLSSLLALPLLLAACTANDIRVSADWDLKSDLAARKSFAMAPDAGKVLPGGHSLEIGTDLYRKRVNGAILGELLALGRAQGAMDKAQMKVVWQVQSKTVHESETVAFRAWVPRDDPWRVDRYETRHFSHEVQILTVTLQEPASGATLWTGSVRAPEIPEAGPEAREARIRELVRRLFAKLPPLSAK